MRTFAGPNAEVHFTHLSQASTNSLSSIFSNEDPSSSKDKAKAYFHTQGLVDLMKERNFAINKVCLLDPKAEKVLSPEDGDGEFEWFLFGVRSSLSSICADAQEKLTPLKSRSGNPGRRPPARPNV